MNRSGFWFIGISIVILLGVGIYFGLQALEPRTYTPTAPDSRFRIQDSGTVVSSPTAPNSRFRIQDSRTVVSLPTTTDSRFRIQDSGNKTVTSLPTTTDSRFRIQDSRTVVSLPTAPDSGFRIQDSRPALSRATDHEAKIYFATSTLREINPRTLKLNFLDVRAALYANDRIVITERPSAAVATSLWQFNSKTKTLTPVVEKERGLMATWSPNGRFALLFSLNDQSMPQLRFIDTLLNTILPIRFTTLPSKCTVTNEQVIYCGVPKNLPPRTALPDDYLKKKIYTDDTVIMIDALNTRIENIFNGSEGSLDISHPVRIDNALFFVNRLDERVYKVGL